MASHAINDLATAATFNENTVNAAAQVIDTAITVVTSPNGWTGGTLTISGLLAEDTLSVRNQGTAAGQIGLSGANITYGGVVIGTLSGGAGASLTITFNSSASAAAIEALLENITYANSSDTPTATRDLTFNLTDALGVGLSESYLVRTGSANPMNGVDIGLYATPMLVDLDNDGDLDLALGENGGGFFYFQNTGTATSPVFTQRTGAANPFNGFDIGSLSAGALVDLDGDGDFDLVGTRVASGLEYFENTGTASAPVFVQRTGVNNPFNGLATPTNCQKVTLGDLDNDGDLDMFVGTYDGSLTYYLNTGTSTAPTFVVQTGVNNPFNGVDVGDHSSPFLIDFDNDGDLDVVMGEYTSWGLKYFENTGTASSPVFVERTGSNNPFNGMSFNWLPVPTVADLNGDGDLDVLVGAENGLFYYIENTGGGAPKLTITVTAQGETPTTAADLLYGTTGVDTIKGLAGLDELHGGDGNDSLDGGDGGDTLYGEAGNDILAGGTGNDTLHGGLGDDTYFVTDAGDVTDETGGDGTDTVKASVSFTLAVGIENLVMLYQAAINGVGNALANIMTGNSAANTISGLAGADTISGGTGNDVLNGGDDNDVLNGDAGNDTLNGDAGTDTLNGGAGNDTLDGGTGDDALVGGVGSDTYHVDSINDLITELAGGGTDSVYASSSFVLGAEVENLTLTGSGDTSATGNALNNVINGNGGANAISAGAGNDIILAGGGADTILSGEGNDTTTGGLGADTFAFDSTDLGSKVYTDRILDFSTRDGDVIDLNLIDANTTLGGDQAFVWADRFTKTAGQAVMSYANGQTTVALDVNGDGKADFKIVLTGDHTSTKTNLYTGGGDTDGGWIL